MTRKDYVKLAATLAYTKPNEGDNSYYVCQWRIDVVEVAKMLAADNPRFNRGRFYKACGLEVGT